MEKNMLDVISIAVQIVGAIIIGRYDPSHSSGPMLCPTWPDNDRWTFAWQSCQQLEVVMLMIRIQSSSADV